MQNNELENIVRQANQVEGAASRIMAVLTGLKAEDDREKTQLAWQAMARAVHSLFAGGNSGWLSEQGLRENLERFCLIVSALDKIDRENDQPKSGVTN